MKIGETESLLYTLQINKISEIEHIPQSAFKETPNGRPFAIKVKNDTIRTPFKMAPVRYMLHFTYFVVWRCK